MRSSAAARSRTPLVDRELRPGGPPVEVAGPIPRPEPEDGSGPERPRARGGHGITAPEVAIDPARASDEGLREASWVDEPVRTPRRSPRARPQGRARHAAVPSRPRAWNGGGEGGQVHRQPRGRDPRKAVAGGLHRRRRRPRRNRAGPAHLGQARRRALYLRHHEATGHLCPRPRGPRDALRRPAPTRARRCGRPRAA